MPASPSRLDCQARALAVSEMEMINAVRPPMIFRTCRIVCACGSAGASPSRSISAGAARGVTPDSSGTFLQFPFIRTSAVNLEGVDELRAKIAKRLRDQTRGGHLPLGTAARCRGSVLAAEAAIRSAIDTLRLGLGEELVAADLRLAMDELGSVVGSVVTDDILDRIFSRFCIGK